MTKREFSADSDDAPVPVVKWVRIGNSFRFKRAEVAPSPPPSPAISRSLSSNVKTQDAQTEPVEPTKPLGFTQLKPHPPFMGPKRRIVPQPIIFR
jgi:hypothetical protein